MKCYERLMLPFQFVAPLFIRLQSFSCRASIRCRCATILCQICTHLNIRSITWCQGVSYYWKANSILRKLMFSRMEYPLFETLCSEVDDVQMLFQAFIWETLIQRVGTWNELQRERGREKESFECLLMVTSLKQLITF